MVPFNFHEFNSDGRLFSYLFIPLFIRRIFFLFVVFCFIRNKIHLFKKEIPHDTTESKCWKMFTFTKFIFQFLIHSFIIFLGQLFSYNQIIPTRFVVYVCMYGCTYIHIPVCYSLSHVFASYFLQLKTQA